MVDSIVISPTLPEGLRLVLVDAVNGDDVNLLLPGEVRDRGTTTWLLTLEGDDVKDDRWKEARRQGRRLVAVSPLWLLRVIEWNRPVSPAFFELPSSSALYHHKKPLLGMVVCLSPLHSESAWFAPLVEALGGLATSTFDVRACTHVAVHEKPSQDEWDRIVDRRQQYLRQLETDPLKVRVVTAVSLLIHHHDEGTDSSKLWKWDGTSSGAMVSGEEVYPPIMVSTGWIVACWAQGRRVEESKYQPLVVEEQEKSFIKEVGDSWGNIAKTDTENQWQVKLAKVQARSHFNPMKDCLVAMANEVHGMDRRWLEAICTEMGAQVLCSPRKLLQASALPGQRKVVVGGTAVDGQGEAWTATWVTMLWDGGETRTWPHGVDKATVEGRMRAYGPTPLAGTVITVSGYDHTTTPNRRAIIWAAEAMGAAVLPSLVMGITTHLICRERSGSKYIMAMTENSSGRRVFIVTHTWVFDCLMEGLPKNERNYQDVPLPSSTTVTTTARNSTIKPTAHPSLPSAASVATISTTTTTAALLSKTNVAVGQGMTPLSTGNTSIVPPTAAAGRKPGTQTSTEVMQSQRPQGHMEDHDLNDESPDLTAGHSFRYSLPFSPIAFPRLKTPNPSSLHKRPPRAPTSSSKNTPSSRRGTLIFSPMAPSEASTVADTETSIVSRTGTALGDSSPMAGSDCSTVMDGGATQSDDVNTSMDVTMVMDDTMVEEGGTQRDSFEAEGATYHEECTATGGTCPGEETARTSTLCESIAGRVATERLSCNGGGTQTQDQDETERDVTMTMDDLDDDYHDCHDEGDDGSGGGTLESPPALDVHSTGLIATSTSLGATELVTQSQIRSPPNSLPVGPSTKASMPPPPVPQDKVNEVCSQVTETESSQREKDMKRLSLPTWVLTTSQGTQEQGEDAKGDKQEGEEEEKPDAASLSPPRESTPTTTAKAIEGLVSDVQSTRESHEHALPSSSPHAPVLEAPSPTAVVPVGPPRETGSQCDMVVVQQPAEEKDVSATNTTTPKKAISAPGSGPVPTPLPPSSSSITKRASSKIQASKASGGGARSKTRRSTTTTTSVLEQLEGMEMNTPTTSRSKGRKRPLSESKSVSVTNTGPVGSHGDSKLPGGAGVGVESKYRFLVARKENHDEAYHAAVDSITRLGATFIKGKEDQYDESCTHIIVFELKRTAKFVCGCLQGKWILNQAYLEKCKEEGRFVEETGYQWGGADKIWHGAVSRWRRRAHEEGKPPALQSWKVVLYTKVKQERPSVAIMQEILQAGGATTMLATTPGELGEHDRDSFFLLLNKEVKKPDKGIKEWIDGGGLVLETTMVFDLVSQQQAPHAMDYVAFGAKGRGGLLRTIQADLDALWDSGSGVSKVTSACSSSSSAVKASKGGKANDSRATKRSRR